jgi:hypothetical protein
MKISDELKARLRPATDLDSLDRYNIRIAQAEIRAYAMRDYPAVRSLRSRHLWFYATDAAITSNQRLNHHANTNTDPVSWLIFEDYYNEIDLSIKIAIPIFDDETEMVISLSGGKAW